MRDGGVGNRGLGSLEQEGRLGGFGKPWRPQTILDLGGLETLKVLEKFGVGKANF